MQAYFSHSYRDVPINEYFAPLFEQAGITLRADQKTDVWCMAKLERYMFEMNGFVSIIPRRFGADESLSYSPYIERELRLARRARVPRVLFVDDQVLSLYPDTFPSSAIPFFRDAPETELSRHVEAIGDFRRSMARGSNPPREYDANTAKVISGSGSMLRDATSQAAALLRSAGFKTAVMSAPRSFEETFDDINSFERMLSSELCVFITGSELSCADIMLAMAHAHSVPSICLRYDPNSADSSPDLSGTVKWSRENELKSSFQALLSNYQSAFAVTRESGIQSLATPQQISGTLSIWDPGDGPGIVVHVIPGDSYVKDRVDGVLRALSATDDRRVRSDAICGALYDRVKQEHFYYTYEPVLSNPRVQSIRTPREINALNCGTCIDFACLFAAMLEAAHESPVVIVVAAENSAHALAGYITEDAVLAESAVTLGDLRGCITRGEIAVFESTGAVEARGRTVGAETEEERKEGGNLLDYRTAKLAAIRLLSQKNISLKHFVNVREARRKLV
jgi:hypothetical protein